MKKLLNTLYVTSADSYLVKDGDNVVVRVDGAEKLRVPLHNLESVVCFGYAGASPALMQACAQARIGLCFLTENGEFCARINGETCGNVLLRRRQYRVADDAAAALKISRNFVAGKIANSRSVIERGLRDYDALASNHTMLDVSEKLRGAKVNAYQAFDEGVLRGIEGDAANAYFGVFDNLIVSNKDAFKFCGRSRRPPRDAVNALLSFIYTLLAHDVQNALESVGLDPYVGFLHKDRPGRASLALDMMEELRAYMADRLVLTLINRRQVSGQDFAENGLGGIILKADSRREVLAAWQKRKRETIRHPLLDETVNIGLIPHIQAMLLARVLRGDLDEYPVFLMQP